ncbi:hypothetical protein V511_06670 [Mesotoga sp. Brook.08.YT.4.2.5.1]|nr:hypothetical protein V511_06670 [Mesotoga sp. Brook.08.YT.4.2.5.1]PVD16093.1 hypothetical protein V512_003980 [Mesotoga sp. Brook.08.105.5.1]RAM59033.1 hypothetical protein DS65_01660 [Mesotoga sp. SC_4PWL113PWK15]RAO95772.1 hypothetical protein M388_04570 [Mesotoga sp. Brook.08.YT.4.2.5.4.]RDI94137.1 hypothetical protein Q502_01265 [Mesotoga sp. Brook.08.YT.4.2.5.2.]
MNSPVWGLSFQQHLLIPWLFLIIVPIRFGFIYINDLSHLIDLPNDEDNHLSFNRQKGLILIHKPILVQKVLFLKTLSVF